MAIVAWQGWRLEVPRRWNPVKLEGDFERGLALFADLHRPRLGLRWARPRPRLSPEEQVHLLMCEEVGKLASEMARPLKLPDTQTAIWGYSLLFTEPEPPGRDVWIGYSAQSDRVLQVIYHAHRRENILAQCMVPTLRDLEANASMAWSIFELSCLAPAGMRLQRHRLNAGDLSLTFTSRRGWSNALAPRVVSVRQIALAQMALKRMPLPKWLAQQQSGDRRHYRVSTRPSDISINAGGRLLSGCSGVACRRRRYFWARAVPPRLITYALHDIERDRLVIVESSMDSLALDVAATIGWARDEKLAT